MDDADDRSQNPYTALEGYMVLDDAGNEIGEVEGTVYDVVSDVLKYLSVNGHAVLADRIEVDPNAELVRVPYDRETVGSAPALQETSGAFDAALRAHYGEPGRSDLAGIARNRKKDRTRPPRRGRAGGGSRPRRPYVNRYPEGGLRDGLPQPRLDHPGVLRLGVGQDDEHLGGVGLTDKVGDAQGIERAPDGIGFEALLRTQRPERQANFAETESSSRRTSLKSSGVSSSYSPSSPCRASTR